MLNQQDDDRGRNLAGKDLDNIGGDLGHSSMLETTRNSTENLELRNLGRVLAVVDSGNVSVDQPTDKGVQKDDEHSTQGRHEEEEFAVLGELVSKVLEAKSQEVEQEESSETHGRIERTSAEMLKNMDDNEIR